MSEDTLDTVVKGTRVDLFRLVLKTGALMLATAGLYSFWARTRLRRWLWSSVRPGGMPLEYTGEPLEKLIGFFVAGVLVVFYVGLVMMIILFYSMNIWGDPAPGMLIAASLVLPLYFVAQYRGRRYLVNHTSWRGLSFSMTPGAFGYMWRCFLYIGLMTLSFGLLKPLKDFRLQKYMIDRTWFGNEPFFQDGSAWMLYKVYAPLLICTLAGIGVITGGLYFEQPGLFNWLFLIVPASIISWVYYEVASFRLLASNVIFSAGTEIEMYPRTGRIMGIHIKGNLLIFLILSIVLPILMFMIAAIFGSLAGAAQSTVLSEDFSLGAILGLPEWVLLATVFLFYFGFFVMRAQLKHVFITFPKLQHAAETLLIHDASIISSVQRGRDQHMADADGLSGFFDFGGGV